MKKSVFIFVCTHLFLMTFSQEANTNISSDGRLRYYSAENEDFFVSKDYSSFARISDGTIVQKKYDDNQRLVKETSWQEDETQPSIIREYMYNGNNVYANSSEENNFSDMLRTIEKYNSDGTLTERAVYSFSKTNDGDIDIEKTNLMYLKRFYYDNADRLIEETTNYEDETEYDEQILYEFKLGDDKADIYMYSNEILKKSIVYSSSDNWVETVYFNESLFIKTFYVSDSANLEEVFENGIKIRERQL